MEAARGLEYLHEAAAPKILHRDIKSTNILLDDKNRAKKWPGLPRGVKFDPSDEELLWHLLAEIGEGEAEPHPFIAEFIISLADNSGFAYSFPHKLPGVKQDGSLSYFFHRSFKAHENKSPKCRKIINGGLGTVCWRKIGKTKPVYVDGIHKGSKQIMVLYMNMVDGEKPEKTNWRMHQYHVGVGEDVEGELAISKIFYQLKFSQGDMNVHDLCMDTLETVGAVTEPEVSLRLPGPKPYARSSNSISMEVLSQDVLMDNSDPKDAWSSGEVYCGKAYCNMINEEEASQHMSNPSHSRLDTRAHTGSLCRITAAKVTCETSTQTGVDFQTSNMLDHSVLSGHATHVKVEPSDYTLENTCNEVADNISPAAMGTSELLCEPQNDKIDHVTLQERYKLMLSSMNDALGCQYNLENSQDMVQCASGFASYNRIHDVDSEVIPRKERHEVLTGHLESSYESISAPQDSSFRSNINGTEECFSTRVKDEIQHADAQLSCEERCLLSAQRDDVRSMVNSLKSGSCLAVDQSLPRPSCPNNVVLEASSSDENQEPGNLLLCQTSSPEIRLPVISREPEHVNDSVAATCSSMSAPCLHEATSPDNPSPGRCRSQQQQEGSCRYSDEECISGSRLLSSVEGLLHHNNNNNPSDTVPSVFPLGVKVEPLEESNTDMPEKIPEELSSPAETDLNSNKKLHSSVLSRCSIKPKLESMESGLLGPPSILPEIDIPRPIVKGECIDDLTTDFIDHIPLRERMQMLTSTCVTNLSCERKGKRPARTHRDANLDNALQTQQPPECGSSDITNAKTKRMSLRRKRKKTATDSVETALEEDAPGLLQVLLDKGITAEEIKLYGDVEDKEALPISSLEDSFEELETVIAKLFSEGRSIFKFPSVRQTKGSKAVYCLACLVSLIEQARYLRFRQSPVEWGWCRDLQSFIFVFERHNRIVLERPEYGYATYFFELVESLPIDWQIKRLVTAMKLPCCSRTILLENKPLSVGEDLTEGEACVMEEYGWTRNSGLGTMLNYCDRVVHDKKNERYSLEWRAKIGKLLMNGHDSGRTVLCDLPKKAAHHVEVQDPEVKLET